MKTPLATAREPLVDEDAVARHIGTTARFLQADRAGARLIPFYRVNRLIRYRLSEVDQALAQHCRRGRESGKAA